MKKLKFTLAILSLTLLAFSFNVPVYSIEKEKQECWENTLNSSEDDLRCVLRDSDGNKIASCWFCDCAAVAAAIYGTTPPEQN